MRSLDGIKRQRVIKPNFYRPITFLRSMLSIALLTTATFALASYSFGQDLTDFLEIKRMLPAGHYLILLQNNSELRPTGGFIGSIATVDITSYGYKNLEFDTNIYKRDNTFTLKHQIQPPKPLQKITDGKWALRDANWDPDFKNSAEKLAWFYIQEGGEPVRGIIAINASVIADLLSLIGSATIQSSQKTISQDNFFDTLHYQIEKAYYQGEQNRLENQPKEIIVELASIILKKVTNPLNLPKVLKLILQELDEKHIQLYNTDSIIEDQILARNWGGSINKTNDDYLAVNNANIDGGKSSLNIKQDIYLSIEQNNKQLQHYLKITRTHTGNGIWPDHVNNNYLRILLPLGTQLQSIYLNGQSASSYMIENLIAGKSSFEIWVNTMPGERNIVELEYTTTSPSNSDQQLLYQKQSGVISEQLKVDFAGEKIFDGQIIKDTIISY